MPRKQWALYEKVNSADLNQFLADQSVMTFATTAARDAAIPSPTVGMQSAVQASPDLGAPRYYDGAAWTLVKSGFTYPNVLTLASPATDMDVLRFQPGVTMTQNVWYQVTASMPQDSVIFANVASSGTANFEFGIGASGSEVARAVSAIVPSSGRPATSPMAYSSLQGNGWRCDAPAPTSLALT